MVAVEFSGKTGPRVDTEVGQTVAGFWGISVDREEFSLSPVCSHSYSPVENCFVCFVYIVHVGIYVFLICT